MRFYNERVATRHSRSTERAAKKATSRAAMAELRGLFGDKQADPAEVDNTPDNRDYAVWGRKKRHREISMCLSGRYAY